MEQIIAYFMCIFCITVCC